MRGEAVISEAHECVTVLFSDIVGYTTMSIEAVSTDVFDMLNALYAEFDALSDKHGVYKVDTIGDGASQTLVRPQQLLKSHNPSDLLLRPKTRATNRPLHHSLPSHTGHCGAGRPVFAGAQVSSKAEIREQAERLLSALCADVPPRYAWRQAGSGRRCISAARVRGGVISPGMSQPTWWRLVTTSAAERTTTSASSPWPRQPSLPSYVAV